LKNGVRWLVYDPVVHAGLPAALWVKPGNDTRLGLLIRTASFAPRLARKKCPIHKDFAHGGLRIFASECGVAVVTLAADVLNSLMHRNKCAPHASHLTLDLRSNVIV